MAEDRSVRRYRAQPPGRRLARAERFRSPSAAARAPRIIRSRSSTGSSGPENAKQSSVSCAINSPCAGISRRSTGIASARRMSAILAMSLRSTHRHGRLRQRRRPTRWRRSSRPRDATAACSLPRGKFPVSGCVRACSLPRSRDRSATAACRSSRKGGSGASRNSCMIAQRLAEAIRTSLAPAVRCACESFPGWSRSKP